MTITGTEAPETSVSARRRTVARWEALSGLGFVVLFLGGVMASSPPADNAPDASWIADYTGRAHQASHLATGLLLVLAGLCLLAFLTGVWRRVAALAGGVSPLPVAAAAVSAACIAAGGVVMGFVSGGELVGRYPLPGADVLRLSNDLGFALVGVAGMIAAGFSVACLSVQGYRAGMFGRKMRVFGIGVGVVLLGSIAFVPIIVLLVWVGVVAVRELRGLGR
jgi:hypothetical protein